MDRQNFMGRENKAGGTIVGKLTVGQIDATLGDGDFCFLVWSFLAGLYLFVFSEAINTLKQKILHFYLFIPTAIPQYFLGSKFLRSKGNFLVKKFLSTTIVCLIVVVLIVFLLI